jgi:16S rRNA (cytosine967-C5)-methyltransferase
MSPARERAVVALNKIFKRGKKPKEVIEALSWEDDKRERAFLMELVYGVLRYRDLLDWMLKDFLKKPERLSFDTISNLRIAIYQIMYLRVPEWAVVHEAVDVEKAQRGKPSLVNAVLRNFLRQTPLLHPALASGGTGGVELFGDQVNYISVTTSHPRWIVKRWIRRFGLDGALKLAEKNNETPKLTLRMDDPAASEKAVSILLSNGIRAHKTVYSPAGVVLEDLHSPIDLYGLLDLPFVVQDEAAQMITWLLDPAPGEMILDACAAPGGKTTHIAKQMGDSGKIVAVEAEKKRIKQLEENIARLGLRSVVVVHGDIRDTGTDVMAAAGCTTCSGDCLFDRILLDAPCSALGVIRRNPDVKYRHRPADLARLRDNQVGLLQAVSRYLKVGGSMIYSVCSTEPEEGEEVIGQFLHGNPNFSNIRSEYDFMRPFESGDPGKTFYRTLPHLHEMDGFFAARMKRLG